MRKVLISIVTAGTALALAAPASAQYWPQPQPAYGYGTPYSYNQGSYRQVRALQARVDHIQGNLDRLAQSRVISRKEYRSLHGDSHRIEQRLRQAARYGLNPTERNDIERRIARLEYRIVREARDGNRWNRQGDYHGGSGFYGQTAYANDRDRDGRNDRYEDDHGNDHD